MQTVAKVAATVATALALSAVGVQATGASDLLDASPAVHVSSGPSHRDARIDQAVHSRLELTHRLSVARLTRLRAAEESRSLAARAPEAVAPAAPAQPATPAPHAASADPATPPAPPVATAPGRPHHEVVGEQALARLAHVDPIALGWDVQFHPGRKGYLGLADQHERIVHVWVRDHHTVQDVLGTLAHEVAHIYDYEVWTDDVRQGWLDQRGLDIDWWPTCTCDDRAYGAGDIAEALVVLEAGAGEWTGHHGMPTSAQLQWLQTVV